MPASKSCRAWSARRSEKDDAERIVTELFAFWMSRPESLRRNYHEKVRSQQDSLPHVICDYIAGMTDTFIFEQYEKHCGRV